MSVAKELISCDSYEISNMMYFLEIDDNNWFECNLFGLAMSSP